MGMWTIPKDPEQSKFSNEELDDFVRVIAEAVHARRMSVPVIMALEMAKPLSFVSYSSLVIFGPILEMIFDPVKMEKLQAVVSDRNRIEQLITSLENLEKSNKEVKEGESREQR
ncbi:MAG: hypothetical protein PHD82_17930 [Candidatus Riflebacteria bacterium]|nr:hypothetical protein [Candidatus Riflebacteria bacterium]